MPLAPIEGAAGQHEQRQGGQGASVTTRTWRALAVAVLIGSVTTGALVAGATLQRWGGLSGRDQEPAGLTRAPSRDGREVPGQPAGTSNHSTRHGTAGGSGMGHDHAGMSMPMAMPMPETEAGTASASASAPEAEPASPAPGNGLAVASDSYVLAPGVTRFQPGTAERFTFRILDSSGRPVTSFQRYHEKLLHLIVVRRDLTGYQHLHPVLADDGTWSTRLRLPQAGAYRAFTDFVTPAGAQILGVDLFASGRFEAAALPGPSTTASVAGYRVAFHSTRLEGGQPAELHFQISKDGWTVADLEPYLGARGHLVAVREGDLAYLHVHPVDAPTPGSSIRFHASFPSAGRYRLFLQFQHAGQVRTAAFTIKVD